jgi:hypothetical protein
MISTKAEFINPTGTALRPQIWRHTSAVQVTGPYTLDAEVVG